MCNRTTDYFFGGRIELVQHKDGYRTSMDACLLIYFVHQHARGRVGVELGCGSGLVSIGMIKTGTVEEVIGVEIQTGLSAMARQNSIRNGVEEQLRVVEGDLRSKKFVRLDAVADFVVMNPPFWASDAGILSENEEKRIANHEMNGNLDDWMYCAVNSLSGKKKGKVYLVYPARKLNRMLKALSKARLNVHKICPVHPIEGRNAEWILIEAGRGNADNTGMEPPIYLKDASGVETEVASSILDGRFSNILAETSDMRRDSSQE